MVTTMALYGLTSVHINNHGRVVRVVMQGVNGATNEWLGQPAEFEADEVANLIALGDEVFSIFIVPGGTVLGRCHHRQSLPRRSH